jgi:glutamyl-tRNA reductase
LRAMSLRKNRPMFFIDIAVPRDIDPQINQIDNTFLYDIDDLRAVADKNRQERQKEAQRAEEIISQETEAFWIKLKALDIAPTIREIQNRIDEIRKREMELTLKKLGPLTPEQKEAIEQLTASVTDKIVQSSFSELRQLANQPDGVEKISLIKKLFRL